MLADLPKTSVTIEAVTDNVVAYVSLKDAKRWLREDMNILRLAARHTARKLYRSSYNNGAKLFYPPDFLLLDYLIKYGSQQETGRPDAFPMTINRTRQMLQEETGINVKTLNRVIHPPVKRGGGFLPMQRKNHPEPGPVSESLGAARSAKGRGLISHPPL